jgi:Icc-related predicted phosphoesterase
MLNYIIQRFSPKNNSKPTIEISEPTIEAPLPSTIIPRKIISKRLSIPLKILVFADLHYNEDEKLEILRSLSRDEYDVILFAGDNRFDYILEICSILDGEKYGVTGNHDRPDVISKHGAVDMHGEVITVNGVRIAGFNGSHKYKESKSPLYTQEESIEVADSIEEADILLSHAGAYGVYPEHDDDETHCGLRGIKKYLENNDVKYHIHGHLHQNSITQLEDGTNIICVHGAVLINTIDNSIRQLF